MPLMARSVAIRLSVTWKTGVICLTCDPMSQHDMNQSMFHRWSMGECSLCMMDGMYGLSVLSVRVLHPFCLYTFLKGST